MRTSMAAVLAATWLLTVASPADAGWRLRRQGCTTCGPATGCTTCGPSSHGVPSCSSCGSNGSQRPIATEEVAAEALAPTPIAPGADRNLAAQASETSEAKDVKTGNWTPIPAGKPQGLSYAKVDGEDLENLLLDPGTDNVDIRVPSANNPRGIFQRALINGEGKACVLEGATCKELDPKEAMQAQTIEELKKWVRAQGTLAQKEPYATFVGKPETPAKAEEKKAVAEKSPSTDPAKVAEAKAAQQSVNAPAGPRPSAEMRDAAQGMHSMSQKATAVEQTLSQVANPTSTGGQIASALFPKASALLSPVASFFKPTAEAIKTESATQAQALEQGAAQLATTEAMADIESMSQRELAEMPAKAQAKARQFIDLLQRGEATHLENALDQLLTNDELYTLEQEVPVFGENYDNIGDKNSVALAYTQARKQLRSGLIDAVSAELLKSSDPRAKALAKAVQSTKAANARAYDVAMERIKAEKRDRAICFTCGEHDTTEYSFFEEMGAAAAAALTQNGFGDGKTKTGWFNGEFGRTSSGETVLVNLTPDGKIFAHTTTELGSERSPLSDDPELVKAVKQYYNEQLKIIHAEHGGQWPANWSAPQRQAVASLMGGKPPARATVAAQTAVNRQPASKPTPVSTQNQQRIAQVAQPPRTQTDSDPSQTLSAQLVVVGNLSGCSRCIDFEGALKGTRIPPGVTFQNMDQSRAGSLRGGAWPILYLVKNGRYVRLAEGSGPEQLLRSGKLWNLLANQ